MPSTCSTCSILRISTGAERQEGDAGYELGCDTRRADFGVARRVRLPGPAGAQSRTERLIFFAEAVKQEKNA